MFLAMKTIFNLSVLTLLLLSWYATPAFSQSSVPNDERKVIITKRTTEADGTETTETIVKKGKSAENFDVQKYLKENRADNVELDVRVQEGPDDEQLVVVRRAPNRASTAEWADEVEGAVEAAMEAAKDAMSAFSPGKKGFLGVTPKDGGSRSTAGVPVEIVDNSAAQKAGLRDGDVLVRLDDMELRKWDDISAFMAKTKPEQKVRVTYLRDSKKNTVDVVLGTQKTTAWDFNYEPNDEEDMALAVDVDKREKAACLGVYTSADEVGDEKGARVTEFTTESAAREALLVNGDVITAVNGKRVQGHSELWDEIAKYQPGDKVTVEFLRDDLPLKTEATLKACRDNSNTVILNKTDKNGEDATRAFQLWSWDEKSEERLRERQVITIRRSAEGDAAQLTALPKSSTDPARQLKLDGFRAFQNPTISQVTVEFRGEPMATVVSLLDKSGRQLFREELNAFNGNYTQQFDLTDFASETVTVHVTQGDKVFLEKINLNQ